MDYRFIALTRRIAELESAARGDICNCRGGEATVYHTAADLARIRNVHCPVHGERDLGLLVCLPPRQPPAPRRPRPVFVSAVCGTRMAGRAARALNRGGT